MNLAPLDCQSGSPSPAACLPGSLAWHALCYAARRGAGGAVKCTTRRTAAGPRHFCRHFCGSSVPENVGLLGSLSTSRLRTAVTAVLKLHPYMYVPPLTLLPSPLLRCNVESAVSAVHHLLRPLAYGKCVCRTALLVSELPSKCRWPSKLPSPCTAFRASPLNTRRPFGNLPTVTGKPSQSRR